MAFLTEAANRGSISTVYEIENSLKVERTNTEYLYRNVSTAGNAKVWCASMWIKRSELDGSQQFWQFLSSMTSDGSGGYSGWPTRIGFWYSTDGLWVDSRHGTGNARLTSLVLQRDTAAWYHIVVMQDTTQSTDTNRTKIWINGTLLLPVDLDYDQYPAQNADTAMHVLNSRVAVGAQANANYYWSGYIADVHLLDGQTGKTASDFAEYDEDSGIWKPKAYTGAYGTNGFHLKFEDSSNMGLDSSGNGNNLTSNNITAADQSTDTPTNNFATGNNLAIFSNPSTLVLTEGQTKIAKTANGWETLSSTIAVTSGKWYMEMQNISVPESAMMSVFPADIEFIGAGGQVNNYAGKVSGDGGISYYSYSGNIFYNATNTSYGVSWANETNTMAIALDMDNGKVYFARANTWQNSGDPTSGATGTGAINLIEPSKPHMMGYSIYANNTSGAVNFGGYTLSSISSAQSDANGYGTFEYAPPSGYYALCSKNLAEYGG